jgi:hypothetical protein
MRSDKVDFGFEPATKKVCVSLACVPGLRHLDAVRWCMGEVNDEDGDGNTVSASSPFEPPWGALSCEHVQLVPQSMGLLDEDFAGELRRAYPQTQFRLHANVHVLRRPVFADLCNVDQHWDYFEQAARVSRSLGAKVYSAHSGLRAQAGMTKMLENVKRLSDLFEAEVAVEGQYPKHPKHQKSSNERPAYLASRIPLPCQDPHELLVSSWEEYRALFESGCAYALDLSHLNILAGATGQTNLGLVREMLSSERCLEVHVSDNDGSGDQHQICRERSEDIWWMPLMKHIHPKAVIFSEGNHRRRIKALG